MFCVLSFVTGRLPQRRVPTRVAIIQAQSAAMLDLTRKLADAIDR